MYTYIRSLPLLIYVQDEQVDAYFRRFDSDQTTAELAGGIFLDHE